VAGSKARANLVVGFRFATCFIFYFFNIFFPAIALEIKKKGKFFLEPSALVENYSIRLSIRFLFRSRYYWPPTANDLHAVEQRRSRRHDPENLFCFGPSRLLRAQLG
jgi:hypothetical protein